MTDEAILTVGEWNAVAILRAAARAGLSAGVLALPERIEAAIEGADALLKRAAERETERLDQASSAGCFAGGSPKGDGVGAALLPETASLGADRVRGLCDLLRTNAVLCDVLAERRRQVDHHGFHRDHDDRQTDGAIAAAGAAYAFAAAGAQHHRADELLTGVRYAGTPDEFRFLATLRVLWPATWPRQWFKPRDRRRDLVRAAALIIAEIERLDRAGSGEARRARPAPIPDDGRDEAAP